VAALLLAVFPALAGAQTRVAVVPLGEGDDLKVALQVARSIRSVLRSKGQAALDPARILRPIQGSPAEHLTRGEERFQAGLALYDGLEFKKAEAAFLDAARELRSAIERGGQPRGYVRTLHYLGASCLFDSRKAAALSHFSDAIAFAPSERPDAKVFSPEVVAAFDEAGRAARGTLKVSLRGNEVGEVIVNRRWRGVSPVALTGLAPGHQLVEVRRAGRAPVLLWKKISAGGEATAEVELSLPESQAAYRSAEASALKELAEGKPGAGVASLLGLLQAGAVVLVSRQDGTTRAAWAEGGAWTRRYQGKVEEGREPVFAEGLLAAGAVASGCQSSSECVAGEACSSGRCVAGASGSTPIYRRWWFWTAIGAVAAGATVGLVVGLKGRQQEWTAELAPRGGL
jgi:hypothetical protein